jgi:3-isopropylmalate/(R)-2-methylmalate dehydratase small subunit
LPSLVITGAVLPLARANVDTDLIIPARFMKTVTREGLGEGAFEALRGEPGNMFDDPRYRGAPILVAGANFGCGSSREHAVWALQQIGLRAVIAPSFGEIFENNALRNGLVAVRLADEAVERLLALGPGERVTVDVLEQVVIAPGGERLPFPLDPFRKHCLVHGLDEIDMTAELEAEIAAFEEQARRRRPWLDPAAPEEQDA